MNRIHLNIDRLIKCRESLGISKAEAARRIGISQPAYLRYEAGTRTPSIQVIKEMAAVFKTSPEYLTGESNSAKPTSVTIDGTSYPELRDFIIYFGQSELNTLLVEVSKPHTDAEIAIHRLLEYARRLHEKGEG